jgi:hypothetical protein
MRDARDISLSIGREQSSLGGPNPEQFHLLLRAVHWLYAHLLGRTGHPVGISPVIGQLHISQRTTLGPGPGRVGKFPPLLWEAAFVTCSLVNNLPATPQAIQKDPPVHRLGYSAEPRPNHGSACQRAVLDRQSVSR